MDNQTKSAVMQWHYNQMGQDAPFMLRASGEFEYEDGFSDPSSSELEQWKTDMAAALALTQCQADRRQAYREKGLTFAYWNEINIEGDQVKIDKYIADRNQIRSDIPYPNSQT